MSINVSIEQNVTNALPGFKLGIIQYEDVVVSDMPKMAKSRINLFTAHLRLEYGSEGLTHILGIKEWRKGFKSLKIDPSKYRPSSEALLRRVLQEKPMYWVNSAVDTNNFLSMQYALPFGIYNLERIHGDIICQLGQMGDAYEGLNGRQTAMDGKLLLRDETGPFGSPIVDSVRTSIDEKSHHLMQVIFIHPEFEADKLNELIATSANLFVQINGGTVVETRII